MTHMHGSKVKLAIGDTDGLIALIYAKDINHKSAFAIVKKCYEKGIMIAYPAAIIAEAITTLTRKFKQDHIARVILEQIGDDSPLKIIETSSEIIKNARKLFDLKSSRKDTFFDAIVAATAFQEGTDLIFSFDGYYKKIGLTLTQSLFGITGKKI